MLHNIRCLRECVSFYVAAEEAIGKMKRIKNFVFESKPKKEKEKMSGHEICSVPKEWHKDNLSELSWPSGSVSENLRMISDYFSDEWIDNAMEQR